MNLVPPSARPAGISNARRAVVACLVLAGCAGSAQRVDAPHEPAPDEPALRVVTLKVSERALEATLERGPARVTFEAERGAPVDPDFARLREPEIDPPGQSATLLLDRRGHVISIAGESFEEPGKWEARMAVTPTRTQQELDQDLALAQSLPDLLMKDERARKWFRWEVQQLRSGVKELMTAKAPPTDGQPD